jgi:hypothetical protein
MKWVLKEALGTLVALFLLSHTAPTVRRRDRETPRTVISVRHLPCAMGSYSMIGVWRREGSHWRLPSTLAEAWMVTLQGRLAR